jgi:hypothetical protein
MDRNEDADIGLLVKKPIFSPRGERTYECRFDAVLVREYRAVLEQAAKDLALLKDRVELSGETLVRRYIGVDVDAV